MNRKEYIEDIHIYIKKINFDFDRLNELLYLIEEEIVSLLRQIQQSSFNESLEYFEQLEYYKQIIAKCYYNRHKIEISDKLFKFMDDFERTDDQLTKKNLWLSITSNTYHL